MAMNYIFIVKGERVTLNKMDELLCEFQKIEPDEDRYCDLYFIITGLAFEGESEFNKDTDFSKYEEVLQGKDNAEIVVEAFDDLDLIMHVWFDHGPHIFN